MTDSISPERARTEADEATEADDEGVLVEATVNRGSNGIDQEVGVAAGVADGQGATTEFGVALDIEGESGRGGTIGLDVGIGGDYVNDESETDPYGSEYDFGATIEGSVASDGDEHIEAGVFVGLEREVDDHREGQVGVAAAVEADGDRRGDGGQVGIDVGAVVTLGHTDTDPGEVLGLEAGVTVNADVQVDDDGHGGQAGLDVGLTAESVSDGAAAEAGVTINQDTQEDDDGSGGVQYGVDLGVFAEDNLGGRNEAGVTVNGDAQLGEDGEIEQQGIDVGVFGESWQDDRIEGGVTVNADTDGLDVGIFGENDSGDRGESGVTGQVLIDDGDATATVGLFAEGGTGREETSVGVVVGDDGFAFGFDTDGDGDLDERYGIAGGVTTHDIADPDGSGRQVGVDAVLESEDGILTGGTANFDVESHDSGGQAGVDLALVRTDGDTIERGGTVNIGFDMQDTDGEGPAEGGQAGIDIGGFTENRDTGERDELGLSLQFDAESEGTDSTNTVDLVNYYEDESGARIEVGGSVGTTVSTDEDGDRHAGFEIAPLVLDGSYGDQDVDEPELQPIDFGIYYDEETNENGEFEYGVSSGHNQNFGEDIGTSTRSGTNIDLDIDPDGSGRQLGLDSGIGQTIRGGESEAEIEGGVTVNLDVDLDDDGSGGGQAGVDTGFFFEMGSDGPTAVGGGDTGGRDERTEVGATANYDVQMDDEGNVEQQGFDVGFFGERSVQDDSRFHDEGGLPEFVNDSNRSEAGVTINDDADGFDLGVYAENDDGVRSESGVTGDVVVTDEDGSTTATATVGLFAEGEDRSETSIGGSVTVGENVGGALGVDTDGDGDLDEAVAHETSVTTTDGVAGQTAVSAGDYEAGADASFDDGVLGVGVYTNDGDGGRRHEAEVDVSAIGDGAEDVGEATDDFLDDAGDNVDDVVDETGDSVEELLDDLGDGTGVDDALDDLGSGLDDVADNAGETADDAADAAGDTAEAVGDFFGGLVD